MKKKHEVLIEEYKIISNQIIHWDKQYWIKNNFFLAIESLFLTGFSVILLKGKINIDLSLFSLLIFQIIFNILICLIWRSSCLRTKDFIKVRFERAKKIEKKLGKIRLYRNHDNEIYLPKHNASGQKESLLPLLFILLWVIFSVISLFTYLFPYFCEYCMRTNLP